MPESSPAAPALEGMCPLAAFRGSIRFRCRHRLARAPPVRSVVLRDGTVRARGGWKIASLAAFAAVALLTPLATRLLGAVLRATPSCPPRCSCCCSPGCRYVAGEPVDELVPWIPQLGIALDFRLDALALLLALIVTGVGALVLYGMHYSADDEPALGRFAALLLASRRDSRPRHLRRRVPAVHVLEATSVLSYLLISHYTGQKESRATALQALHRHNLGQPRRSSSASSSSSSQAARAGSPELIAPPVPRPAADLVISVVLVIAISMSTLLHPLPLSRSRPRWARPPRLPRTLRARSNRPGGRLPRRPLSHQLRRPSRCRIRSSSPIILPRGARFRLARPPAGTTSRCSSPTAPSSQLGFLACW